MGSQQIDPMQEDLPSTVPGWSRPRRIPQDITLAHTVPPYARANEVSAWRVPFVLSKDVAPDAMLCLQLWGGRNNRGHFTDAETGKTDLSAALSAILPDGTPLQIEALGNAGAYRLDVPPEGLSNGTELTINLGDANGRKLRAWNEHMYNKFFVLYVADSNVVTPDWAGGMTWEPNTWGQMVAAATMHILGDNKSHLRAYAPATVKPGEAFAIAIRPEDATGNLSCDTLENVEITLDGNPVEATITTQDHSTCITATTTLAEEGGYRFLVRDIDTGLEAETNPVVCAADAQPVYWGMIHGHTEMSDGTGVLDQYFKQLRYETRLDFAATGDHDHLWETPDDFWQTTCAKVKEHNAPGEFITFLGYEWAKWRQNGDGDRNVYYLDDDRPLYRSDDGEYPAPPDLFRTLAENNEKAIVIPHHTGHGGNWCDWKDHDPRFERLVEIFQVRGSYECLPDEDNPVPPPQDMDPTHPEGFVRPGLAQGWRVGFTGGGDDHNGHWGTEVELPHKQGLMSVEAGAKTREAIFRAMYDRRVVATTGARILLTYRLNDMPMGSELSCKDHPGLATCRKLAVEVHATAPIERVDIIRNNTVAHTVPGEGQLDLCLEWDDTEALDKLWMPPAKFCDHRFAFYYVRVVQTDNEVAWASPIWLDE